jgi:aminopeptidase N
VPLAITLGAGDPAYTLLATKETTIPGGACGTPVIVNSGNVGFYRVAYDAPMQETLQKNLPAISEDDKLAILSDTSALAQSGRIPVGQALSLYSAVGPDTNLAVWEQVLGSLGTIAALEYGGKGQAKFEAYARDVVRPAFEKLGGWDGPPGDASTEQLRNDLIAALGTYGDAATIAEARKRYAAYKSDPTSLSVDRLTTVLGIVGRNADLATWTELHDAARNARTTAERQRYYVAMLAAVDPELAKRNLAIATSGEIPPETAAFGLRIVGAVAAANPRLAYDFYKTNREQLTKPLSQFERTLGAAQLIGAFWNAAPADELEAYAKSTVSPEAAAQLAKAMEQINQRKAQQTRLVPQVDGYTDQVTLIRK